MRLISPSGCYDVQNECHFLNEIIQMLWPIFMFILKRDIWWNFLTIQKCSNMLAYLHCKTERPSSLSLSNALYYQIHLYVYILFDFIDYCKQIYWMWWNAHLAVFIKFALSSETVLMHTKYCKTKRGIYTNIWSE